jgi:hypothetical protein
MTGMTADSACELIKGNKKEDRASTRKSAYAANFFFEAFFVKNVSNGLAVAGMRCSIFRPNKSRPATCLFEH